MQLTHSCSLTWMKMRVSLEARALAALSPRPRQTERSMSQVSGRGKAYERKRECRVSGSFHPGLQVIITASVG